MTSSRESIQAQAGSLWASQSITAEADYPPLHSERPERVVAQGIWRKSQTMPRAAVRDQGSPVAKPGAGLCATASVDLILTGTKHSAGKIQVPYRPIVSLGRLAIGLAAMLAFTAVAQTFVPSSAIIAYDTGVMPSVAISGTSVVEVHQGGANGFGPLWYRSGRIQADGVVVWNRSYQYDNGGRPSVAVSGVNVVEVHEGTANGFGPLWYRYGEIRPDGTVGWSDSHAYDNGARPSVAVSGNNVIEVHQGSAAGYGLLWYKTGQLRPDGSVVWADSGHPYDYGGAPCIAASGPNIIEVHQGSGNNFWSALVQNRSVQSRRDCSLGRHRLLLR